MNWIFVSIKPDAPLGKDETLEGRFDSYKQAHDAMFQFMKANPRTPCRVQSVSTEE
jgi:hypothetical protein